MSPFGTLKIIIWEWSGLELAHMLISGERTKPLPIKIVVYGLLLGISPDVPKLFNFNFNTEENSPSCPKS